MDITRVIDLPNEIKAELTAKDLIISRLKEQQENLVPKDVAQKWKQRYIGMVIAMTDPSNEDFDTLVDELESISL
jgi:uncharacterized protein YaiL (DUF2058 family)